MIPRELKRHKIRLREAKSPLRHSCSPSERRRFSSYFRNRDSPENQCLLRNLSTHSAPRSIANISWRDRKALSRLQSSKVDGKHHLSPAELALAFFSKVERLRSRWTSPRPPPSYRATSWSQSLPPTSSRKKHFSLRQSNSPTSSCSEILSQSSSCTGKSWQSEPPMPSSRPRYSLVTQASKSQCCCGSHGRGCAKDCGFCCAFNCARVKAMNGKKAGFQILDSALKGSSIVHVDGRIECRSTSNCKLPRPKFDDNYCTRSFERIIVPGTRDTGVCTESESRHIMLRDLERAVITDRRRDRVFDILDCNSKGSVGENCSGEKIMHRATPYRHNVHDKILVGNTNDFHKHNVHDAATGNARDILRLIFHDKAVGNDRDINRYDYDDLHRDSPKNLSRHNIHRDIGVGSARDVSRHVYYENGAANSREDYDDRQVFCCDEHFGPDVNLRPMSLVRDHSTDKAISHKAADRRTRDRECHKPKMKVRDWIRVKDCMKDNTRFSSRENSDSGSYECVQNRRNAKDHSCKKRIGSSKMSFVLVDKPRYFPTGFSDCPVVTESTSGSTRDSSRRHGHVSRKK